MSARTPTTEQLIRPMKFAYADPPYLGQCARYDHRHEGSFGCWNKPETHETLLAYLTGEYPDGWALSLSSPSLHVILPMAPGARIAAWGKSYVTFKPGVRPAYAWEPVLLMGGHNPPAERYQVAPGEAIATPRDFLFVGARQASPIPGAKPEIFCRWVLDLLGYEDGRDVIEDVFPGTAVMAAVARQQVSA